MQISNKERNLAKTATENQRFLILRVQKSMSETIFYHISELKCATKEPPTPQLLLSHSSHVFMQL